MVNPDRVNAAVNALQDPPGHPILYVLPFGVRTSFCSSLFHLTSGICTSCIHRASSVFRLAFRSVRRGNMRRMYPIIVRRLVRRWFITEKNA